MFCCGLISFFTVLSLGTFITTTTVLISHDNFLRVKGDLFNYHLPFIVMSQYFLPQTLCWQTNASFFFIWIAILVLLNCYNKMFVVYGFVILSTANFWRGCRYKELCEGEVMPGQRNTPFTFNNGTSHLVSIIVKMKSSHTYFWSNKKQRKSRRQGTQNELSPVSPVLVFIYAGLI